MNANMMRAPLIKSAAVLLIFVLLAYLTSASPEGGVLNSAGMIIIGAFRLVQWALAMAIGLAVCIAFLIGIFLFGVSLVDRNTSAKMYQGVKQSLTVLGEPIFSYLSSIIGKESKATASPVQPAIDSVQLKNELQTIIAGEVQKVANSQQALNDHFISLNTKIQVIEEKSAGFAATAQLSAIADEIASSGKILGTVQESVATLEGKLGNTVQQLQAITPEKMLGDLPARLEKLEQKLEESAFDPQPLTESLETLEKEVAEMKKKPVSNKTTSNKTATSRAKKRS
jgi:polyhydroxyalkanoate synthesis regulator phasin